MFLENLLCAKQMYVMKRTCATTAPYMLFLMCLLEMKNEWINIQYCVLYLVKTRKLLHNLYLVILKNDQYYFKVKLLWKSGHIWLGYLPNYNYLQTIVTFTNKYKQ